MRREVDSRYAILRPIGSGGVGEIFLARDAVLGREVALKVLSRRCAGDARFVERFRREARGAASLSHPNVVAVHDCGEISADDGSGEPAIPYMVMEYVPGITLADLVREEGALSPRAAASIALGIARGLGEAHRRGLVHRDVKPANVLLAAPPDGKGIIFAGPTIVKVADFGVARSATEGTLTEENAVVGTAHYLSPEQARGEPVGPQSDLYSLGVVLYEMLTGRRPFEADTSEGPLALVMKHATEIPLPPREANPEVPEGLDALTLRLLSKDPKERYEDAWALAEELEGMAVGGRRKDQPGDDGGPTTQRMEVVPAEGARVEEEIPRGGAERTEGWGNVTRKRVASATAVLVVALFAVVAADAPLRGLLSSVPSGSPDLATADAGGGTTGTGASREGAGGGEAEGAGPAFEETTDDPEPVEERAEERTEAEEPLSPEARVRRAALAYYEAVDRESWAYTYTNLGSQSRQMFTEREWYQKNQWFADNEGLELASMEVEVTRLSPSGTHAEVNVRRTFENGVVIDRGTVFVFEDGSWKHRLVGEELLFFMPGAPYEEFVEAW